MIHINKITKVLYHRDSVLSVKVRAHNWTCCRDVPFVPGSMISKKVQSLEHTTFSFPRRQTFSTWPTTRNLVVEPQVLLRMCAKLLLGGGPQGIANLQLLQGFLRNTGREAV